MVLYPSTPYGVPTGSGVIPDDGYQPRSRTSQPMCAARSARTTTRAPNSCINRRWTTGVRGSQKTSAVISARAA
jgi:hypothetical protein